MQVTMQDGGRKGVIRKHLRSKIATACEHR